MINLFSSARIKLTVFYLIIVMAVSITFSGIIYRSVGLVFQHRLGLIETRMRRMHPRQEFSFIEDVQEAKNRVLITLIYINVGIFMFAAGGGYWLAGKTLRPIEQAMEDQKRFVADASHELRTPLTALKTSMEVGLRDKKLTTKKAKKIISDNLESVNQTQSLVNNLLSLARYDQNGQNLKFEEIDLSEIVERSVEKIKPLADQKNIKISLKLDEVVVSGDKNSLERMITIFLDNAVKYTDKNGKIKVKIKRSKNKAVIKISDNGRGIPEENLPYIFDRFYRVDDSRCKDDVCGYGLGLSVAKKIIDLHQGKIEVESQLGEGTAFAITLPSK
jgi:two-component system, OmpR family, sensor histidine kinase CiaH